MAHPLLVLAFLAYPSRRPGRLYTSDVRQRLPTIVPHLRGCHNRPPAALGATPNSTAASPHARADAGHRFTDRQSEASVPLAFVGRGGLVLARVRSP